MPRAAGPVFHAKADGAGRLAAAFAARPRGGAGLVAYITAGDPDAATSLALLHALAGAGALAIELGVPAARPFLDGPVIQAAHRRVAAAGFGTAEAFALLRRFRARDSRTPVVLMGYAESLRAVGPHWFVDGAARAGADGLLVVDAEGEERAGLIALAAARGLDYIPILHAGDGGALWLELLAGCGGFAYCVASPGRSGGTPPDLMAVAGRLERIRAIAALPLVAGFGVRTKKTFRALAPHADGIAVGTALVECVAEGLDKQSRAKPGLTAAVADLAAKLRRSGEK